MNSDLSPEPQSSQLPVPARRPPKRKWENAAEHIQQGLGSDRQDLATSFIRSLPILTVGETPLQIAEQLARNILLDSNKTTSSFKEVILVTLCITLHKYGLNQPEEVDEVLKTIIGNSGPKYLDVMRRGAKLANEIIIEWASQQAGDNDNMMFWLGCATLGIYTGNIGMYYWGVMADYKQRSKERILSYGLPRVPVESVLLLIPCVVEYITGGKITSEQVCHCFGYGPQHFSASMTVVEAYSALRQTEAGQETDTAPMEQTQQKLSG